MYINEKNNNKYQVINNYEIGEEKSKKKQHKIN